MNRWHALFTNGKQQEIIGRFGNLKENEKLDGENDPTGLILCAQKDDVFAKYVLGDLNNQVFASKYKLALPSEKELTMKLKSVPELEVGNNENN